MKEYPNEVFVSLESFENGNMWMVRARLCNIGDVSNIKTIEKCGNPMEYQALPFKVDGCWAACGPPFLVIETFRSGYKRQSHQGHADATQCQEDLARKATTKESIAWGGELELSK